MFVFFTLCSSSILKRRKHITYIRNPIRLAYNHKHQPRILSQSFTDDIDNMKNDKLATEYIYICACLCVSFSLRNTSVLNGI